MKTFKSLSEGKIPTVGQVNKILKSLDFEFIYPEFFSVEKKDTDAGMGGYNYIQITFDSTAATSKKRASDVKLAIDAISTKWKSADTSKVTDGLIIIRD